MSADRTDQRRLGDLAPKLTRAGLVVGIGGVAASALVAMVSSGGWPRFFRAYLVAFIFVLSLCLGGLFWTALQHAVRAGWSVVLRRLAEGVASNLRWLWLLFIPIVIALLMSDATHLYHWAAAHEGDALLEHKAPYLNVTFWLLRAAVFFSIWAILARFFGNNSVAQDANGDVQLTHRLQWFAPLTLLLYAFTQTYAAVDWIKALEAHWFSTMFGVYFFAASCCGFFSALILIVFFLQRRGRLTSDISAEHYQDMGKQLFAFGVVFWAYIAFSQFMLIWYANIPEETTWFMTRTMGPWLPVTVFLLFGHFIIPFLFLITKHTKRRPAVLAVAAGWMLFMHFIDVYWMVMPLVPADKFAAASTYAELQQSMTAADQGYGWHLLDLTCLIGLVGLLVAGTSQWLGRCTLVPEHDPRFNESLAFENM